MIQNIDFSELEAEKYYDFPKNYAGNKKMDIYNFIFSNEYVGSCKKDGHYFRLTKDVDGSVSFHSREKGVSGLYNEKFDHLPQLQSYVDDLPRGTCLLGEIYFTENSSSKKVTSIMGSLTEKAISLQQPPREALHYWVFDVWAFRGESMLNSTIEERIKVINELKQDYAHPYVEYATYYQGKDLFDYLQFCRVNGEEGIVMTRIGSKPEPGKRTKLKTLKVKKELDCPIDCFIGSQFRSPAILYTGKDLENWEYWMCDKTMEKFKEKLYYESEKGSLTAITKAYYYNWKSALEMCCIKDGKEVHIGWVSGISDEIKEIAATAPEKLYHKVIKVNAMEIEKNSHAFRHAAIIEWRTDIPYTDCTWDKIFGEEDE